MHLHQQPRPPVAAIDGLPHDPQVIQRPRASHHREAWFQFVVLDRHHHETGESLIRNSADNRAQRPFQENAHHPPGLELMQAGRQFPGRIRHRLVHHLQTARVGRCLAGFKKVPHEARSRRAQDGNRGTCRHITPPQSARCQGGEQGIRHITQLRRDPPHPRPRRLRDRAQQNRLRLRLGSWDTQAPNTFVDNQILAALFLTHSEVRKLLPTGATRSRHHAHARGLAGLCPPHRAGRLKTRSGCFLEKPLVSVRGRRCRGVRLPVGGRRSRGGRGRWIARRGVPRCWSWRRPGCRWRRAGSRGHR